MDGPGVERVLLKNSCPIACSQEFGGTSSQQLFRFFREIRQNASSFLDRNNQKMLFQPFSKMFLNQHYCKVSPWAIVDFLLFSALFVLPGFCQD
jgi:hypothetical protein